MTILVSCLGISLGIWAARSQFHIRRMKIRQKDLKEEILTTRELFAHERRRCRAYERALGLPVYSVEACEADLWARAAQGDELAEAIIHESMYYEEIMPVDAFQTGASR